MNNNSTLDHWGITERGGGGDQVNPSNPATAQRGRGGGSGRPAASFTLSVFRMEMSGSVESISPLAVQAHLHFSIHLYSLPGNSQRQKQFRHL